MPRVWRPPPAAAGNPVAAAPAPPPAPPPPNGPDPFAFPAADPPPNPRRRRGSRPGVDERLKGITQPAIRRLARRGGVKRISGLIYEEARGVLKVFLENTLRDAVTYCEHARRKTVTAMDVVYALKRQGRTLYGYGGESGSWGRKRTAEEAENERVEKAARRLAFQAHRPGQAIPSNAQFRQHAQQQIQAARPAVGNRFEISYQGHTVTAVPVGSVFAYEESGGRHRLVKQERGANADLYDAVIAAEAGLCDVGTGVSVSQSLRPSADGGGLLYQAGCKLLVAQEGATLKGLALVCTYEIGEGLVEPRSFGRPTDDFVRAQAGASVLMLELICARGAATADGRNANYLAAKGLIECMKRYATAQGYGFVVCKAENARSRDFLGRRGFALLFQRGAQAAMQVATAAITV